MIFEQPATIPKIKDILHLFEFSFLKFEVYKTIFLIY